MTTIKKVTPVEGKIIPMQDGNGNLPPEGKNMALTSHWYRLESDGDVTFSEPDPSQPVPFADDAPSAANAATSGNGAKAK